MDPTSDAPIVMKFGGAALADGQSIRRAGEILLARGGSRPVAVVSAAQGVTELLLSVAAAAAEGRNEAERIRLRHRGLLSQCALDPELLNRLFHELFSVLENLRARRGVSAAERDFVLSFGERMSARIVAASLRAAGHDATPVDAFDLGLISDSNHGRARPLDGYVQRIRRALGQVPGIPVVTGFVAKDSDGNLTTLGRNGSDLSASLLGEAAGAREVQFWKVVGGVMSADPKLVPAARSLAHLSYRAAAEYAFRGANVLHPSALAPLERAGIPARVLCTTAPQQPGTTIHGEDARADRDGAIGVTARRGIARIVQPVGAQDDRAQRVAAFLADAAAAGAEPSCWFAGPNEIEMFVPWTDELGSSLAARGEAVRVEGGLALVALVGARGGQARAAADALAQAQVASHLDLARVGGASALFAVSESDVTTALRAVHAAIFEVQAPLTTGRGG